jgi:hypothetical protein
MPSRIHSFVLTLFAIATVASFVAPAMASEAHSNQNPLAAPSATINRHDLFLAGLSHLSAVFEFVGSEEFLHTLTPIELDHFSEIKKIAVRQNWVDERKNHYHEGPPFKISFETDQNYFTVQPGAPVRTARADSSPNSNVLVNELVISNPANSFRIADVIQLLIHELGHRLANQDQQAVDSMAAKVRAAIEPHIQFIDLNDTAKIEILSLAVWDSQGSRSDLEGKSLLVLRETPTVVENMTDTINDFFEKSRRLVAYNRYGTDTRLRRYLQWIQHREMNTHDGTPIIRARIARQEKLVGDAIALNPYTRPATFAEDRHEIEIDFDRRVEHAGQIRHMRMRKAYEPASDVSLSAVTYRWVDENQIEFTAELHTPQPAQSLQLLVEVDGGDIEVAGKNTAGSPQWIFNLRLPEVLHTPKIEVRSAIANRFFLVLADTGVDIDLTGRYSATLDQRSLHSIILKTPLGDKSLSKAKSQVPRVLPGSNKLKFIFTGEAPIQELRIAWGRSWQTYNVDTNVQQSGHEMYRGPRNMQEPEGLKVDYEIVYYTDENFQQRVENGHRVIEIDVHDTVENLYSDQNETYQMGGFGMFNTPVQQTLRTLIGRDTGNRFIAEIEAVDDRFNRVHIRPPEQFFYSVDPRAEMTPAAQKRLEEKESRGFWEQRLGRNSCGRFFDNDL